MLFRYRHKQFTFKGFLLCTVIPIIGVNVYIILLFKCGDDTLSKDSIRSVTSFSVTSTFREDSVLGIGDNDLYWIAADLDDLLFVYWPFAPPVFYTCVRGYDFAYYPYPFT